MRSVKPPTAAALTLVAACVVPWMACRPGGPDRGSADAEPSTSVTVLQIYGERITSPLVNMPAMHLLYMPMFKWSREGELEGRLVKEWEHSPDGRTWTYRLRTDIRWHDGVPVTAHDIKFTYDFFSHPDVLRVPPGATVATVIDDSTLTVRYESGFQHDPLDTWRGILPKHHLEHLDPATSGDWDFWTQPVGNGPYRWVRYAPDTMIELEANPDFYLGEPEIDRVILKLRGGGGNTVIELESGNVDIAGFGTVGQTPGGLDADPRFEVYWSVANSIRTIYLNHRHPALGDARVRKAITLGIDRRTQRRLQGIPDEAAFFDVPIGEGQLRRGDYPPALPFDPGRARELLAEAGWVDADGDGIRERDSQPLEFTLLGRPGLEFIQDQLRRIGIRMEIVTLDGALARGRFEDGDFDAYGPTGGAAGRLRVLLGDSDAPSAAGYRNLELLRLADQLESTLIPEEQDSIRREMWPIFHEDVPVLFLGPNVFYSAAHKRVRGLESPSRVFAVSNMEELWVEDDPDS